MVFGTASRCDATNACNRNLFQALKQLELDCCGSSSCGFFFIGQTCPADNRRYMLRVRETQESNPQAHIIFNLPIAPHTAQGYPPAGLAHHRLPVSRRPPRSPAHCTYTPKSSQQKLSFRNLLPAFARDSSGSIGFCASSRRDGARSSKVQEDRLLQKASQVNAVGLGLGRRSSCALPGQLLFLRW